MKDNIHIVSTASLPAEDRQRLKLHGFNAELIPFIRTFPSVNAAARARILELQHEPADAVFTSAHGVKAVAEQLQQKPAWEIACINGATLESVKTLFPENAVVATGSNAKELAAKLTRRPQRRVMFFCGNKRLNILPDALTQAGKPIEELIVYTTELTPQTITADPDAVLFFSTSAVESFFMKNKLGERVTCFAIGETTAEALRKKAENKIVVAERPGKKEMIDLVINYYHEHS